jgi:RHS repeat-associated protein
LIQFGVHGSVVDSEVLERTHYYPFGFTIAGISSKALAFGEPGNKRKFNDGTELESKEFSDGSGLDLYSTEFRSYDAQIGRFHQIDPLGEFSFNWSSYTFVQNNPILYNGPLGLDTLKRTGGGALPTTRPDGSVLKEDDVVLNACGTNIYYNGQSWQEESNLKKLL